MLAADCVQVQCRDLHNYCEVKLYEWLPRSYSRYSRAERFLRWCALRIRLFYSSDNRDPTYISIVYPSVQSQCSGGTPIDVAGGSWFTGALVFDDGMIISRDVDSDSSSCDVHLDSETRP